MEYAPFGDLYNTVVKKIINFDQKLVRTYFRQILSGLEFLHNLGIAHLDLKPDNIFIAENNQIKIADFDMSYIKGDPEILSFGTCNFRSPEIMSHRSQNPYASDIYSLGCVLFFMITGGLVPRDENDYRREEMITRMIRNKSEEFWDLIGEKIGKSSDFFSKDFKELFFSLINDDASARPSIEDIKNSKWFCGEVYSDKELKKIWSNSYLIND